MRPLNASETPEEQNAVQHLNTNANCEGHVEIYLLLHVGFRFLILHVVSKCPVQGMCSDILKIASSLHVEFVCI